MNKCYRLVFNRCTHVWQVVTETACGRGRGGYKLLAAAALTAMLPLAHAADPMELIDLGNAASGDPADQSAANAVSANGTTVVGYSGNHAMYWTQADGMVAMPTVGTFAGSQAYAVNSDGTVIVGQLSNSGGSNGKAFRWVVGSAPVNLGTLETGAPASNSVSSAYGVNGDGSVVVGEALNDDSQMHAFRWVDGTGMSQLFTHVDGVLIGSSSANAVNKAGDVVVGSYYNGSNTGAFRWTASGSTVQSLGALDQAANTSWSSSATGVNAAGDVVVGRSTNGTDGSAPNEAFRWTAAGGMVGLGTISGYTNSYATATNASGNVVVGYANTGSTAGRGFRWEAASGMQTIEQWLAASGVDTSALTEHAINATGVNEDGSIVVGTLSNARAYLARGKAGLIDLEAFNASLARVAPTALLAENQNDLVFHGMHGNPMQMLLKNGASGFWVAGDLGRQDREARKSDMAVGEVGYGKRFNDAIQMNVAVGQSYSSADTGLGGKTRVQGNFIVPEVIVSLPKSVYATLSGFYGKGSADIDRGYLNTGVQAFSKGSADTESRGARLRLDWYEAAKIADVALTPYVGLSYLETNIDAYTETGGGFPAHWNKRKEKATTARVGIDAAKRIGDNVKVTGRLEGVHRFEDKNAGASGQIVGISSFAFAGQDLKQNWLRAGAGVEGKVGGGIASATLNATTEGEVAAYWLAVNYRWQF